MRSRWIFWLSPRIGRELYDLSDETRRKGLHELARNGLITVSRRALHQGMFADATRTRYVYELAPDLLSRLPAHSPCSQPDPFAFPE